LFLRGTKWGQHEIMWNRKISYVLNPYGGSEDSQGYLRL